MLTQALPCPFGTDGVAGHNMWGGFILQLACPGVAATVNCCVDI